MATTRQKAKPIVSKAERIIALVAGESGAGKSFVVASLPNALIIDTDIGGGLRYADSMIQKNGSQRVGPGVGDSDFDVTISEYPELLAFLTMMDRQHQLDKFTTLAIDHLTTLHDNAVARHNPKFERDFGSSNDVATKEWKRVREFCRTKDFNLVCVAHLKGKWKQGVEVGQQANGPKEVAGDMDIVLHLNRNANGTYPSNAQVIKWRRLPDDARGKVPAVFPMTFDNFVQIDGTDAFTRGREPVVLASPDQVAEITKLLEVAKVDDKTIEKWFKAVGAESWAEVPSENIDKAIGYVRNLIHTATNSEVKNEQGVTTSAA